MSCIHTERLISAYVDDELAGVEMLRLKAHLRKCETCRNELASLRQTKRLLGTLPTQDADDALLEQLCASIAQAPKGNASDWVRRRIIDPVAVGLGVVAEKLDHGRVRWAGLGAMPIVIVALICAHLLFGTSPDNGNPPSAFASTSEHGTTTTIGNEGTTVMPMLIPMGGMSNPELQLAVDESFRRNSTESAVAQPASYEPR